jgi:SAM-dependent methyltransferase
VIFDKGVAAHYEAWYETPEGQRADELEKAVLGWLLQGFARLDSVLEIGCGTGHFSHWLGAQGLTAVGLDLSPAMLAEARVLGAGPLVRADALSLRRRLAGLFRRTVYDGAHFYGVSELKRLLRLIAGEKAHVVWRTTLFPRGWPWAQARLPWGGFIGMALIVNDGVREAG